MPRNLRAAFDVAAISVWVVACGTDTSAPPRFAEVTDSATWPLIVQQFPEGESFYMPLSAAPGAGWLDADLDGDLDALLIDISGRPPRLVLNEGGAFREAQGAFPEVEFGMGVATGDMDNDGATDVFITTTGTNRLFRNVGGRFEDVTAAAGLDSVREWSASAMWIDYDRDGWLDLFVTNYLAADSGVACSDAAGRPEFCGPNAYPGLPDRLWRNRGDGTFADVSADVGIGSAPGKGLGVAAADVDNDGTLEIYVANDGEPNFLWTLGPDGVFSDVAVRSGVAVNAVGRPEAGMGIAVGDADGDGSADLFVTHLGGESHTLYRAFDGGLFVDETSARGLQGPSLPYTGFGTAFSDVDNDGDLDLIVANGRINRDIPVSDAPSGFSGPYAEPDRLYLNDGRGFFTDAGEAAGDLVRRPGMSRGLASADFDDDGRIDVLVIEAGGPARLYRNTGPAGHWVGLLLVDATLGGRVAIGARATLFAGARTQVRSVFPNAGYLSSHDPRIHFGLGGAQPDSLEVVWPDGVREMFPPPARDAYSTVERGEGT